MDTGSILVEVDGALHRQLQLTESPDVAEAASALLAVLEPALRRAVITLAEQAALEAAAQLPGYRVGVAISDGDPQLQIEPADGDAGAPTGDNDARLTLRLPDRLKAALEEAAARAGDSVNSFVVNTLAARITRAPTAGSHIRTSIEL